MVINERLPSQLEKIPGFLSQVIKKIETLGLKEEEVFEIRLCLEEALTNAMKHGNKLDPDLSVEVDIEAHDNRLTIKVVDQGQGFDFENLPDPTDKDNLLKTAGRGIFLIKNLMNKVEFSDRGRVIKMIKLLTSPARR